MDFDYRTFFVDLKQDKLKDIETILINYNIEKYLLAHEQFNRKGEEKPHIHALVYTTKKNLTNLVKHIVDKYELRNTTGKNGGRRHFGTHAGGKPIHDMEKFATYLCKDGNIITTFDPEQVKQWMNNAYQKEHSTTHMEKALELLINQNFKYFNYSASSAVANMMKYQDMYSADENDVLKNRLERFRKDAIKIILENDLPIAISKININKLLKDYIKLQDNISPQTKAKILYSIIFKNE